MIQYMVQHTLTSGPDLSGFLTSPKALPYAQHIFGTRADSASDSNQTVRSFTERLGPIAHMRQVHGSRVVHANASGLYEECDGLISTEPGLWLAVKTADCVPVLISGPGVVAAVHAGWRGLQAEIIPQTITEICSYTGLHADDLHMAIGPCISQNHYEVEDSFARVFEERFFKPANRDGHLLLDVTAIASRQAREAGLPDTQVRSIDRCTYAEADTFNSYRRHRHLIAAGQTAGYATQLSLIRLQPR